MKFQPRAEGAARWKIPDSPALRGEQRGVRPAGYEPSATASSSQKS